MTDLALIYRDKSSSLGSKATLAVIHFGIVLVVLWMLFGDGTATVDGIFGNEAPVGLWEVVGGCLVAIGSVINTGSEWQRHVWKQRPANEGHLFTGGLFQYSRHINYFGDVVLFSGWALMTGRPALLAVPTLMVCGFVFVNVPAQDRYLAERYGEEYKSTADRTARLIPYVY